MSNQDCNCADLTVDQMTEQTPNSDNWIEDRPVKTAGLPETVADNMSQFFGESIESFDDMVAAIRGVVEGNGISIDELCHVEGETTHYAQTDDQTYYFRCFYDGIALAHLMDERVEIRTETPTNEFIEIRASPEGDLDVTPSDVVMTFGVATESDVPIDDTAFCQGCLRSRLPVREGVQHPRGVRELGGGRGSRHGWNPSRSRHAHRRCPDGDGSIGGGRVNLPTVAILGSQAVLGLGGLGVGGAKVIHQEDQVEDFQRFGYPQWFRIVTGVVEIGAGAGLIAGLLWLPELTLAGGLLLSSVMVGAVVTHLRTGDPPSKAAVPTILLIFTVGLLAIRYLSIPV